MCEKTYVNYMYITISNQISNPGLTTWEISFLFFFRSYVHMYNRISEMTVIQAPIAPRARSLDIINFSPHFVPYLTQSRLNFLTCPSHVDRMQGMSNLSVGTLIISVIERPAITSAAITADYNIVIMQL